MHILRTSAFLLLLLLTGSSAVQAQGSLQRVNVTSVTLRIDTVQTQAQMETVTRLIRSHQGIRDYDLKGPKCNFTFSGDQQALDAVFADLRNHGYQLDIHSIRAGQEFTMVPEQSCMPKKKEEITEEEYIKQHPEKVKED